MKRKSIYATMTTSDLVRITRERGLKKPDVITLSEWADFLEADDKRRESSRAKVITDDEAANMPDAETDEDRDTEDADSEVETPIPAKRHALKTDKSKKGES
jgi:hypothetical protein